MRSYLCVPYGSGGPPSLRWGSNLPWLKGDRSSRMPRLIAVRASLVAWAVTVTPPSPGPELHWPRTSAVYARRETGRPTANATGCRRCQSPAQANGTAPRRSVKTGTTRPSLTDGRREIRLQRYPSPASSAAHSASALLALSRALTSTASSTPLASLDRQVSPPMR